MMLDEGAIGPTWRETAFPMLPKAGDLGLPQKRRPIAILKISRGLFARRQRCRHRGALGAQQSDDQFGFRTKRSASDVSLRPKLRAASGWTCMRPCGVDAWTSARLSIELSPDRCVTLSRATALNNSTSQCCRPSM
eukprot:5732695-Pyramimonas_sp.AAC.1